ncbi:hypothetical protein DBR32_12415 [Taibaiella sp. KBW10]|uniref:hypothetical protein n=1 Tax=Taibaiella sp. KBW10 TaxID=2153357 RepID=UPI000F598F30|nr:hypothetical protein [Taibaiella sp. KBW10]RQO30367.1 hypothetical protein DBR32_12415 [Taibaiella sp. KBW10]
MKNIFLIFITLTFASFAFSQKNKSKNIFIQGKEKERVLNEMRYYKSHNAISFPEVYNEIEDRDLFLIKCYIASPKNTLKQYDFSASKNILNYLNISRGNFSIYFIRKQQEKYLLIGEVNYKNGRCSEIIPTFFKVSLPMFKIIVETNWEKGTYLFSIQAFGEHFLKKPNNLFIFDEKDELTEPNIYFKKKYKKATFGDILMMN